MTKDLTETQESINEDVTAEFKDFGEVVEGTVPNVDIEVTVKKKDIPEEVEITHLKHPENHRIFEADASLLKRKDLIPCDKDGNRVYDNRRFGRFN